MADIPDLSKSNGQAPPTASTPPIRAAVAFLVIVQHDGTIVATSDTTQAVGVAREATPDDIYAACSLICKDVIVQQTAALTQQAILQMGAALQQQAQTAKIRSGLNLPGSMP